MGKRGRTVARLAVIALAASTVPLLTVTPGASAAAEPCTPRADYDNDNFGDLAIGIPKRDTGGKSNAGAVTVVFGDGGGLSRRDQFLHQNKKNMASAAERGDRFGSAVASADFDGDDWTDLAIGVPGENGNSGGVHVLFGGGSGVKTVGSQLWTQDSGGMAGNGSQAGDSFGTVLAVGDFNNDTEFDLAVGIPGEDISGTSNVGAVHVLYGAPDIGLQASGAGGRPDDQRWDAGDVAGASRQAGARFGSALAVCDFNDDGNDDLAIGIPRHDLGPPQDGGAIAILYGSDTGLTTTSSQFLRRGADGIDGPANAGARFGSSLAGGDFDGDGIADLGVGAPKDDRVDEAMETKAKVGSVTVLYGAATGLNTGDADLLIDQGDLPGVGHINAKDQFGTALAAGDFNVDGKADLAIGVPFEDYTGHKNTGQVEVLYGSDAGVSTSVTERLRQGGNGLRGASEDGDRFGEVLWASDLGGTRFGGVQVPDLAIGAPKENDGSKKKAGTVHVVFGAGGLAMPSPDKIDLGTGGIIGKPKAGDHFGAVLG